MTRKERALQQLAAGKGETFFYESWPPKLDGSNRRSQSDIDDLLEEELNRLSNSELLDLLECVE